MNMLPHSLANRLLGPGWPGHLLALLAGALTTLGLAPFGLWPFSLLGIALFYLGLRALNPRQALLRGWLWGMGQFAGGVHWVYVSMHVHGDAPPLLAGLLTAGFVAGLALLVAGSAWLWARWLRPARAGWLSAGAFAGLWLLQEMFRSWFLTGFPWLHLGYAHTDSWLAGWAPLGGVWLLSLISVLVACLLAERQVWQRRSDALGAVTLLVVLWGGGWALQAIDWTRPAGEPLSVTLIQADVSQSRKWDPQHIDETLRRYRDLSYAAQPTDLMVWSETAVPVLLSQSLDFVQAIAGNLEQQGTTLITGIPVDDRAADGRLLIYNGIMVAGSQPGLYLKHKLVPFGEYVPLEDWLRGLIAFFDLPMSSFSRGGADQSPLHAAGYRLAPYICYEVVYPDFAARLAANSELLITISNDTWFGASIGPLQHLQMARMRALESGRWMIRGTNNGVTALIDHKGRISAELPQFRIDVLQGQVEPRQGLTPWLRWGSLPVLLLALALLSAGWLGRRQQQ